MIAPSDIELPGIIDYLTQHTNFPTFDEFKKNPDKYRARADELFESVDGSSHTFRKRIKKQSYMWRDQYKCDALENIERICREEGFTPFQLEMEPTVRLLNGTSADGDVEIIVRFWPKDEFRARGGVVANDKAGEGI